MLTGATLDPLNNFSNVTFDNGPSGGTFLYVENLLGINQVFAINSASFPSDPGGGAANVTKSISNDTLDFLTATGSFAGEDNDNDPGNLVRWGSVSDLLTWTGSASTNWHTASNWSPVGVPDITKAVVITDQVNDPVIGNDNAGVLNVTLNSGATLTIQDGFDFDINGDLTNSNGTFIVGNTTSTLNIAGDWANNGTFTHGNSTVTFDGTEKQSVNGGGTGTGKALHNMYCTNPDTIELQGTLDVQMIDQTLGIAPASVARHYTIETQNSAIATVRLYYGQDELQGEIETDLQIWRRRNHIWEPLGGTVNSSLNYVEVLSLSYIFSAGDIDTLILSDAQTEQSLPVELLSFMAVVFRDSVDLKWETASELENAFWLIDKKILSRSEYELVQSGDISVDETNREYNQIAQIQGMGSKPTGTTYNFVDHNVDRRKIYAYRLSSVSFNGEIEFFTPVIASYSNGKSPLTYTLEQNYPNPFNPVTTIIYQIPFESKINIEVYNILGQKVITLIDDKKLAGYYDVQWDGHSQNGAKVASGIYIYRMTAEAVNSREKFSQNMRMIMLK